MLHELFQLDMPRHTEQVELELPCCFCGFSKLTHLRSLNLAWAYSFYVQGILAGCLEAPTLQESLQHVELLGLEWPKMHFVICLLCSVFNTATETDMRSWVPSALKCTGLIHFIVDGI